jgi:hypothetical protein
MFKKTLPALSVMAMLLSPISAGPAAARHIFDGVPVEATIMRSGATAARVRKIKAVPSVGVVNLRLSHRNRALELLDEPFHRHHRLHSNLDFGFFDDDYSDYRVAASRNAAGVKKLQDALRANPATRKALASRRISITRIVGVEVGSSGALRVYIL